MWTFRIAELLKHVEPAPPAGKPVGYSILHLLLWSSVASFLSLAEDSSKEVALPGCQEKLLKKL